MQKVMKGKGKLWQQKQVHPLCDTTYLTSASEVTLKYFFYLLTTELKVNSECGVWKNDFFL